MEIFDRIKLDLTDEEKSLLSLARTHTRGTGKERLTVREMVEGYLELQDLRPVTRQANAYHLRFLVGLFGDRLARCVGTPEMAAFREIQRRRGIALSTISRRLTVYKAAVNWAVESRRLSVSPLAGLRIPSARSRRPAPPTVAELQAMLCYAAPHVRRVIILGLYLGARTGPSELFRLRWADFDARAGVIRVPHAAKSDGADGRDVPVRSELIPMMERWREEDGACPWIIHFHGRPVCSVSSAWHSARRRAGISRRITCYGLRHAFATYALRAGADLRGVAELMGHDDVTQVVRTYDHIDDERRRATVESLPALAL